jgi:hypothetical protein
MRFSISFIAVMTILLSANVAKAQGRAPVCRHGEGRLNKRVLSFQIRIEGLGSGKSAAQFPEGSCRVEVVSPKGEKVFQAEEIMIERARFADDLNGDNVQDAVFLGFSGGAHCCWTLWVVSLGDPPGLLQKIENQTGFGFTHGRGGRVEIRTGDGAFDYFDSLSHADSPIPGVTLRLEGSRLVDAGPDHWTDYETWIGKARYELLNDEVRRFKAINYSEEIGKLELWHTKGLVLQIVLAYLYGGRPADARKALDEMWPAFDRERIWDLILKTREEGILKDAVRAQPK